MYSLAIKLANDAQVKAANDAAQVTTDALNSGRRMASDGHLALRGDGAEPMLETHREDGISEKPIRVLKDDDGAAFLLVEAAVVKGLAWHLEQMADPSNELCETADDETAARQLAAELRAVA